MDAPVVTVVVPGRGEQPGEVLALGDPAPRTPVPPSRWVALAGVAVLALGVVQVAGHDAPAPPPPRAVAAPSVTGVGAVARDTGLEGGPLVERYGLTVVVDALRGRGDSGSPSEQDQVDLLAVTGRGFFLELPGVPSLPLDLGPFDRGPLDRGGASIGFDVSAQVSDCAIETQAQRTMELQVRRAGRTGLVKVAVDGEVVTLLDRLVARTCLRPRG